MQIKQGGRMKGSQLRPAVRFCLNVPALALIADLPLITQDLPFQTDLQKDKTQAGLLRFSSALRGAFVAEV